MRSDSVKNMSASLTRITRQVSRTFDLNCRIRCTDEMHSILEAGSGQIHKIQMHERKAGFHRCGVWLFAHKCILIYIIRKNVHYVQY